MRLAPNVPFSVSSVSIGNGMSGVRDTLYYMRALARDGSKSAQIRNSAVCLIWLQPARNELHEIESIFNFVRDSIRYVRDPLCFESVATPEQVISLGYGDCDDKSTLLASMLESVGYPTRFVVAGYRMPQPDHVYVQVFANGEWIDADPTEFMPLGYAPPNPVFIEYERI